MDSDIQRLLQENLKLSRENHEILKQLQRYEKVRRYSKVIYWIIIIFIVLGGYFYIIDPLIQRLNEAYDSFNQSVTSITTTTQSVQNSAGQASSFIGNIFNRNNAE
ncbi:MAG: hypothetical protein LRY41_00985 [Candidatus Pacebacteria bacterium]|nr:hypothetical protein [Candidatus Paceibacterota bacterium]MCD8507903.1 hypothetical protein [Candidatus Paceibacterota bacterium]MCD8527893.1 hypothetical protein [Candidatus Paceibacterota bacterium]MCD8563555.1 hypothetical protein [Candidatus Paceibacterota bacterium]